MKFFNSLYMSVLLVLGFACLNSYETKVYEALDAHNYVLNQIVDKQSNNLLILLEYCKGNSVKTDSELVQTKKMDSDLKKLKKLNGRIDDESLKKITLLFKSYDIEEKLKWKGAYLSFTSQKHFYDKIEEQAIVLFEKIRQREKFNLRNNVDVIITEREESYEVDKSYELNFAAVFRGNQILEEASGSYKIGDDEFPLQYFPLEFSIKPDSISFLLNGIDKVTGETYNIKERHHLELQPLP